MSLWIWRYRNPFIIIIIIIIIIVIIIIIIVIINFVHEKNGMEIQTKLSGLIRAPFQCFDMKTRFGNEASLALGS